ncbi:hypothetical protein [Caulobacter sp. UC70_42]|uniref:hypothetical protein n=1 Tax=Caulobacter sp. UC70_42 TaxID=3374551 RepID=UPI003757656B
MSKPISMTALLTAIGDEGIGFQNLDHSTIKADWSAKSGTKITFGTDRLITIDGGTDRLGLVLWLDREQVAETMARLKAEA